MGQPEEGYQVPMFDPKRIGGLADATFAIVMTLLVLELKVPEIAKSAAARELAEGLRSLIPNFVCFVISFITVGRYWIGHHNISFIKRADRRFLWINLLLLMTVALVPFSTALVGRYPEQPLSLVIYGGNLITIGLILYLEIILGLRLTDGDVDPRIVRWGKRMILVPLPLYAVAVAASFIHIYIAIAVFVIAQLLFFYPPLMHKFVKKIGGEKMGAIEDPAGGHNDSSNPGSEFPGQEKP